MTRNRAGAVPSDGSKPKGIGKLTLRALPSAGGSFLPSLLLTLP